ncbi:hypothetical protein AT6N2_C2336 [Agrobacterium tumefaciens]|nr:hypothetical protein AT6N2_C2336 [Agrobacterium tumefaciens]
MPVITDGRPQRDADEGRAAKAGNDLRDMNHGLHVHDDGQDQDRIEGAVFQIAVFGKRPLLHQHDGHGAHIHGADAEADSDDEKVLRQCESADYAIEGEAGIQYFEIKKRTEAALCRPFQHFLAAIENAADHFHQKEGQQTPDRGMEEGIGRDRTKFRIIAGADDAGKDQHHDKYESDFDALDGRIGRSFFLDPAHPMHILLMVEEEVETDHHQEGAAKCRDRQVSVTHDFRITFRLGRCHDDRRPGADIRGDDNDQQRKDDTHAKNGNQNTPGQEAMLPDRRHVLQLVGIDDGIVEGKRNFQHRQNDADEEDRGRAADRAGHFPAKIAAEDQTDDSDDKSPLEVGERGFLGGAHVRSPFMTRTVAGRRRASGRTQKARARSTFRFFIVFNPPANFAGGTDITRAP